MDKTIAERPEVTLRRRSVPSHGHQWSVWPMMKPSMGRSRRAWDLIFGDMKGMGDMGHMMGSWGKWGRGRAPAEGWDGGYTYPFMEFRGTSADWR